MENRLYYWELACYETSGNLPQRAIGKSNFIDLSSYYIVVVFIDPLQGLYAILFGDTVDWFHLPTT